MTPDRLADAARLIDELPAERWLELYGRDLLDLAQLAGEHIDRGTNFRDVASTALHALGDIQTAAMRHCTGKLNTRKLKAAASDALGIFAALTTAFVAAGKAVSRAEFADMIKAAWEEADEVPEGAGNNLLSKLVN